MKNKCKICDKICEEEYCFRHKPRKSPSKMSSLFAKKLDKPVKNDDEIRKISEMKEFFLQIWKKRGHFSEISGTPLGKQPLTIFFHHILPKEKYPQAAFDEQNIILLTFDEHTAVESDMYKYERINEKRNLLLDKYNQ